MNIKSDHKQKKLILHSLHFQKKKMENSIYLLNAAIENKKASILKFQKYQHEYMQKMYQKNARLALFIKQSESFLIYINQLLDSQTDELLSLESRKDLLNVKYNSLLKKIDGMNDLMSALSKEKTIRMDKNTENELLTTFLNKKKNYHG